MLNLSRGDGGSGGGTPDMGFPPAKRHLQGNRATNRSFGEDLVLG